MDIPASRAIPYGAILFGLGMIPGMFATPWKDCTISWTTSPSQESRFTGPEPICVFLGDIWLLVGGGVMMLLGLLALLLH